MPRKRRGNRKWVGSDEEEENNEKDKRPNSGISSVLTKVITIPLIIILALYEIVAATITLITGILSSIAQTAKDVADRVNKYKIGIVIAAIAFGAGYALYALQPFWMSTADIGNECYATYPIQLGATFYGAIADVANFIIRRINDVAAYLRDCVEGYVLDIRMIKDILSVDGVAEAFLDTYLLLKNILAFPVRVQSLRVNYVTPLIGALYGYFYSFTDVLFFGTAGVIDGTILGEDCGFCALDPQKKCFLMQKGNCSHCIPYEMILCRAHLDLFDAFTFGYLSDYFYHLRDPCECLLSSWKPTFFLVQGLIDGCVSRNGEAIADRIVDIILGTITCIGNFLNALTYGEIDDFLNLIFSYALGIISIIVRGIDYMGHCFNEPAFVQCLNNFPDGNVPGECTYSANKDLTGGLHVCFDILNTCMDNPDVTFVHTVFYSGFNLFEALPFMMYGIDFVVCPWGEANNCMRGVDGCISTSTQDAKEIDCLIGSTSGSGYGFRCVAEIPLFTAPADAIIFILEAVKAVRQFVLGATSYIEHIATSVFNNLIAGIKLGLDEALRIANSAQEEFDHLLGDFTTLKNNVFSLISNVTKLGEFANHLDATFRCLVDKCFRDAMSFGGFVGSNGGKCNVLDYLKCFPHCYNDPNACSSSKKRGVFDEEFDEADQEREQEILEMMQEHNFTDDSSPEQKRAFMKVVWKKWLTDMGVQNDTMCGEMIHSIPTILLNETDWATYAVYFGCFIVFRFNAEEINHPILYPMGSMKRQTFSPPKLSIQPTRFILSLIGGFNKNYTQYDTANNNNQRNYTTTNNYYDQYDMKKSNNSVERLDSLLTGDRMKEVARNASKKFVQTVFDSPVTIYNAISYVRDLIPNINDSVINNGTVMYHKKWNLGTYFMNATNHFIERFPFFRKTRDFISNYTHTEREYDYIIGNLTEQMKRTESRSIAYRDTNPVSFYDGSMDDMVKLKQLERDLVLIELYVDYVDDVRLDWSKKVFLDKLKRYDSSRFNVFEKLKFKETLQHRRLTSMDMYNTNAYINKTLPKIQNIVGNVESMTKIMGIISKRYGISGGSVGKVVGMAKGVVSGNISMEQLNKFMSGELEYDIEHGMVHPEVARRIQMERDEEITSRGPIAAGAMALISLFTEYDAYRYNPGFKHIFMIRVSDNDVQGFMNKSLGDIKFSYDSYKETAKSQVGKQTMNITTNSGNTKEITVNYDLESLFDFNHEFFNFIDTIVSFFHPSTGGKIVGGFNNLKNYWTNYNPEDFISGRFKETVDRLQPCEYPANTNGTLIYTPACLPFIDEKALDWVKKPDEFPLQIPWPQELIETDCVNPYNGSTLLFQFKFSDNCDATDGLDRPKCPSCDYCKRTYRSCRSIGFVDFIDSIFYSLASLTSIVNSLTQPEAGISIWTFRKILFSILGIVPLLTIIGALIIMPITISAAEVAVWITYVLFGDIVPYGVILLFATIIIGILLGSSLASFAVVYSLLVAGSALWLTTQFVPLPKVSWSIPIAISNILNTIDSYIPLPYVDQIASKAQRFDYTNQNFEIPNVDTFCFFWTFSNVGLAYLIIFLAAPPIGILLYGTISACFSFLTTMALIFVGIFQQIRTYTITDVVNKYKEKYDAISNKVTKLKQNAKKTYDFVKNPMSAINNDVVIDILGKKDR